MFTSFSKTFKILLEFHLSTVDQMVFNHDIPGQTPEKYNIIIIPSFAGNSCARSRGL